MLARALGALAFALATALVSGVPPARAEMGGGAATSTPEEITTTAQLYLQATNSWPACGMWHPSGICFFLSCSLVECHIETSERYSHMLPDLVFSSWHDLANHPWPEIGIPIEQINLKTLGALYKAMLGDSAGTRTRKDRTDKNPKFRDIDAIGHPGGLYTAPYLCNGAATAFQNYYSSILDAPSWRNFFPVDLLRLESWIPGLREIGNWPLNTWGNVYPRTGWHTHQHDVKVGATVSQRAADIVTRQGEPRTYIYLSSATVAQRNGQTVFDPPPALENLLIGGQWQMSAPFKGAPSVACHVFGENDSGKPVGYGDFSTSKTQSYAYTLWRPYACCDTRGGFLFSIVWGMW